MTPNMNSIWEDMLTWRIFAQMKVFCFKTMSLLFFPKTSSLSSHTTFVLQIRYRKTIEYNIIAPELVQQCSQLAKLSHGPQFSCFAEPPEKFPWARMWLPLVMTGSLLFPDKLMINQAPYSISSSTLYMDSWPGRDGWMDGSGGVQQAFNVEILLHLSTICTQMWKNLSLGNLAWI